MNEFSKPPIQRRHLLTMGAATAAAMTGVGAYFWQSKGENTTAGIDSLWQMQFDTPAGSKLAMSAMKGKPLLINFWATWCPPCIEELPLLERFYVQNKLRNMQIVGLAADKPEAVRTFLAKLPLTFPIGITDLSGISLSKSWGNLSGGLPFTVMLAADGKVMQRKIGKLSEDDLKIWLDATQ